MYSAVGYVFSIMQIEKKKSQKSSVRTNKLGDSLSPTAKKLLSPFISGGLTKVAVIVVMIMTLKLFVCACVCIRKCVTALEWMECEVVGGAAAYTAWLPC